MIESYMTDHFPIFLVRKKERHSLDSTSITCRSSFEVPYSDLPDPDLAWKQLWDHIVRFCDYHCPFKTFKSKTKPSYSDNDLIQKMRSRDKAFKKARRSKLLDDLKAAKKLRHDVTRALRKAKRAFILKQLDLAKGYSKAFWSVINSIFLQKSEKKTVLRSMMR